MFKKIVSLLLAVMFVFSLSSCGPLSDADTTVDHRSGETAAVVADGSGDGTDEPVVIRPVIPKREPDAPMTVCIDAGHGYSDPGATTEYVDGRFESELTAEIAEILKDELEGAGYRVIMLRDDSHYLTVEEISAAADAVGLKYVKESLVDDGRYAPYNRLVWANTIHRETYIDFLVSIHLDSYGGPEDVWGTRLYYCSENDYSAESERLCLSVTNAINERVEGRKARYYANKWDDAYAITKRGDMPSFLIEMGYISNQGDAEAILNDEWRHEMAKAMVKGFEDYFGVE